jgi:hypothetical protein
MDQKHALLALARPPTPRKMLFVMAASYQLIQETVSSQPSMATISIKSVKRNNIVNALDVEFGRIKTHK